MEVRRGCAFDGNCHEIFGDDVLPPGKIMQISVSDFQPGQDCPLHSHYDLHEFFFCEAGEIDITVNKETIHLRPSDAILVRPGSDHSLLNTGDVKCTLLIMGIACPK